MSRAKTKRAKPSKQTVTQKKRWTQKNKLEARKAASRERARSATKLLNQLLHDLCSSTKGSCSAEKYNVALDFLGLLFLRNVVEDDNFRNGVRKALRMFDKRMKQLP